MDHREDLLQKIAEFIEMETEVFGDFPVLKTIKISEKKTGKQSNSDKEATERFSTIDSASLSKEKNQLKKPKTLKERLESCSTLEQLQALCEESEELKTDLKGTTLVFGVGNPNADLMLIGEAPGEQEDKQGEPFVGAAGQLLNKILAAINFKRKDVYITNILKHRPPGNRNPTAEERLRSLPYLLRQIDIIQPKLILCLGKISGTTLLKKETTLRSMRGEFYPFRGADLTVTYHPAALLRHEKWKRPVWEDVQRVRKRYDELGCKP